MQNIIFYLARYHVFLLFLLLETICLTLVYRYNHYQRSSMLSTANKVSGNLLRQVQSTQNYLHLRTINDSLMSELAQLRNQNSFLQQQLRLENEDLYCRTHFDTTQLGLYEYVGASVINNTLYRPDNYITINKGSSNGIAPEMGVISNTGVVGIVKNVSPNFSTILSLLHRSIRVSAKFKSNNFVGSLRWDEKDSQHMLLDDIPKHAKIILGDTITTSGYSSFFPPDVMIGTVAEWKLDPGSNFYYIRIKLSSDFNSLKYIYAIKYLPKQEQENLEQKTQHE